MTGTERLTHAYIIAAAPDKAAAVATERAAALLCEGEGDRPCRVCRHCRKVFAGIHPDVITVLRETDDKGAMKRELRVDQIRAVSADAVVRPNEAARKVYVIPEAGAMNLNAQNAMLKLLEEPPAHAAFILCAANPSALLPTVRSRCVLLRAEPENAPEAKTQDAAASFAALARDGGDGELFAFCEGLGGMSNQEALAFCAAVSESFAARLPAEDDRRPAARMCELMAQADRYLRVNTGVRHVMGLVAVRTIGIRNEEKH